MFLYITSKYLKLEIHDSTTILDRGVISPFLEFSEEEAIFFLQELGRGVYRGPLSEICLTWLLFTCFQGLDLETKTENFQFFMYSTALFLYP